MALSELHKNSLIHRDVKPGNVLLKVSKAAEGQKTVVCKLADFGQCVPSVDPSHSLGVGTKWYKAPEIMYSIKEYDDKVDIWSFACVLAELLDSSPLCPGSTDFDQLSKIAKFLGPPDQNLFQRKESQSWF
jgi:serine/threonine protein kinase